MHFENDDHNFTFKFDSNDGKRSLEINFNELYLGDILDRFKEFLQGCGYEIDGYISVIPWEDKVLGYQSSDTQFDFSNISNNNWPFGQKEPEVQNLTQASEK
jgi:hypothetical protein